MESKQVDTFHVATVLHTTPFESELGLPKISSCLIEGQFIAFDTPTQ